LSKSESGAVIDRIIACGIRDWFQARGFRRLGRWFFRNENPVILTASVQASKLNVPDDDSRLVHVLGALP
jgi:hypothetical protein